MRFFLITLFQLLLAACIYANSDDKIKIVVSIQPIAEVVQAIGGDSVDVNVIIRPGESPHHFSPKPHQLEALKKADLVVMNGAGLDHWIAKHFLSDGEKKKLIRWDEIVKKGDQVVEEHIYPENEKSPIRCTIISDATGKKYAKVSEKLLEGKKLTGFYFGKDDTGNIIIFNSDINLGNPDRGEFYFPVVEKDHHASIHVESDPHFWLNPQNMILLNTIVAQKLVEIKKTQKVNFSKRSKSLSNRLSLLDSNFQKHFSSNQNKIVTFDNAFKHLSMRYHFVLKSVSNSHHGHEVSPKQREEIVRHLKKEKIKTLFVERNTQRRDVKWIVERSGVKTAILDPNIYPGVKGYSNYFEMMESNLRSLQSAQ